jgi:hypothetical protein
VIVVAGVKRDLVLAPGRGDRTEDIEGLIPIERGDLDRQDIIDLDKTPPELEGQQASTRRGLEIEPEDRDQAGDLLAMVDELIGAGGWPGGQAEQSRVVTSLEGQPASPTA